MLREERLKRIKHCINQKKYISFHELISDLDLSKSTIRRDLKTLTKSGQIRLIRGGACAILDTYDVELPYELKQKEHSQEKERIAEAASHLIKPNTVIMIDCGTTTRKIVPYLASIPNLHVITTDIIIAHECISHTNIDITVIGGKLRRGYYNLTGHLAYKMIENFSLDLAFLSTDAVSLAGECLITNIDELAVKQAIISASKQTYLLCDHTKFASNSLVKVCLLSEIQGVITGKDLDNSLLLTLEKVCPSIILA